MPEYVAFDVETTGLHPSVDRIVEIGAVRFDDTGREIGRFESLVDPGIPIPAEATSIHGIRDEDVKDRPGFDVVVPAFFDLIGCNSDGIIAHNAIFDTSFIDCELDRLGFVVPLSEHWNEIRFKTICTLSMARNFLGRSVRNHRLPTLASHFNLNQDNAHRSLADAIRVKELFLILERMRHG